MEINRFLLIFLLSLVASLSLFELYAANYLRGSVIVDCKKKEDPIPEKIPDEPEWYQERNYTGGLDICDIVFGVLTYDKNRHRMKDLDSTWGRLICRNEKNLFYMSNEEGTSPNGYPVYKSECEEDLTVGLCCKTMKLMKRLYQMWPEKKWFFRSDDDTLVIPETLRRLLGTLDPDLPYYIGLRYYIIYEDPSTAGTPTPHGDDISKNLQYASGGGGMVFSRALMKKAQANLDKYLKYCQTGPPYEDVVMGLYFKKEYNVTLSNGIGFSYSVTPKGTPITYHMKDTHLWRSHLDFVYTLLFDKYQVEKS